MLIYLFQNWDERQNRLVYKRHKDKEKDRESSEGADTETKEKSRLEQYELAREVVTDQSTTEKGQLVDELVQDNGLDATDAAPESESSTYSVEELKKYPREKMSSKAQASYDNVFVKAGEKRDGFKEDLSSRLSHLGLIDSRIDMNRSGHKIVEETIEVYNSFINKVGFQYQKELYLLDQQYQADQNPDEDYYTAKYEDLAVRVEDIFRGYDETVRVLMQVAGSQDGADSFIDAGSDWTELSQFHENGLNLMRRMTPPDNIVHDIFHDPNYKVGEFKMEDLETACTDATAIIEKIWTGNETLNQQDYQKVIDAIKPFFNKQFDTKAGTSSAREALSSIESTGMMTAVYAMNTLQRYELGRYICQLGGTDAKKGIRFLTGVGVLDIGQAQDLLTKNVGQYAFFDESELSEIRELRTQIDTVRKDLAESASSESIDNLAMEKFTASNGLLYEIVFRFAALGVVLPFLLNITKLGDLGTWDSILTNPFWMGCVGVSAVTLDHITGGIGSGYVTRAIAGIGVKGESEEAKTERLQWAEFNRLVGDHPQTVDHLLAHNGEMLADIVEAASYEGDPMDEGYPKTPADFSFSYENLIEFQMTEQGEQVTKEQLSARYKAELDGQDEQGTEQVIANICRQLFNVKGVTNLDQALSAFDESDRMRGLKS